MRDLKIGVLGMGYVGLPLAIELSGHYSVIGYDTKAQRISELRQHQDRTGEVPAEILGLSALQLSEDPGTLATCNVFIVTVPTPLGKNNRPDLGPLIEATETVSRHLKREDLVIYESTVYPGCTEEICVPLLEKHSGLRFNQDFFCGYSPERTIPGDREHGLKNVVKLTSGSTLSTADQVDQIYSKIVLAGTYKVSSIRVAEAAKVIENTQRDINIAFVNELALIFNRLGIDTNEVLKAAGTKWNFAPFKPGLVGGHCVGVDPFYLTFKAQALGYHPEMILAGRKINDGMGVYVAGRVMKLMIQRFKELNRPRVLIMGATFKENCLDVRNSRVFDVYRELKEFGCQVEIYDPIANEDEVRAEYGVALKKEFPFEEMTTFQAVIFAVAHRQFLNFKINKQDFPHTVIYDLKGIFDRHQVDERL